MKRINAKFRKFAFLIFVILLLPAGALLGSLLSSLYAKNSIQSSEGWKSLGAPPTRVIQLLGFCKNEICVETASGQQYRYNSIDCSQIGSSACWLEIPVTGIEPIVPHLYNPCMYQLQIPSPPSNTIQILGAKVCGSGGDYYDSYALLEDGSVWRWDHSVGDIAGLGDIYFMILGMFVGFIVGLLIAIILFVRYWPRVK